MVRNFLMVKIVPNLPIRAWIKIAGPREVLFIAIIIIIAGTQRRIIPRVAKMTSNIRLIKNIFHVLPIV